MRAEPIHGLMAHERGRTVPELADLLRVGEDRVRRWIKSGALAAIDTSDPLSPRRRFVILPESLGEFLRGRSASVPPKPKRRRRRHGAKDYYPEPR
jgi:hypothetical protein